MKLTQEELRSLIFTNQDCFEHGRDYFKDGFVELLFIQPYRAKACVVGTRAYIVSLRRVDQTIEGHCTCLAFEESTCATFEKLSTCKHLSATGFALMAYYKGGYTPSKEYFQKAYLLKHIIWEYLPKSIVEVSSL